MRHRTTGHTPHEGRLDIDREDAHKTTEGFFWSPASENERGTVTKVCAGRGGHSGTKLHDLGGREVRVGIGLCPGVLK